MSYNKHCTVGKVDLQAKNAAVAFKKTSNNEWDVDQEEVLDFVSHLHIEWFRQKLFVKAAEIAD